MLVWVVDYLPGSFWPRTTSCFHIKCYCGLKLNTSSNRRVELQRPRDHWEGPQRWGCLQWWRFLWKQDRGSKMLMGPPDKGGEVAHSSVGCEGHTWGAGRGVTGQGATEYICLFKTDFINRKKWRSWFNSSVVIGDSNRFAYLHLVTCVKWKLSRYEEKHDPLRIPRLYSLFT